jgi:hypothetical protein
MVTTAPLLSEFFNLLGAELSRMRSINRRVFIRGILVPPYQSRLAWEHGAGEPFEAWTFGDLGERDMVAQFCRGGFGALGSPWGINSRTASHFGKAAGWYPSLEALAVDWGVPE